MYTHTVTSETQPQAYTLPPSLPVSPLSHIYRHTHTHTHKGHGDSQHQTTELELWTGGEGSVHDMNKKSPRSQSAQLFDAIYSSEFPPSFFP